ncbi:MAG TPA: SCO6880 family protein [Acidimicrobiales bacterium]|nr:SCO6880 family protein [Acidimicrobiales bacterium]
MSIPPAEGARYRFGPLERKATVAGLAPGQVVALAASLVAAVMLLRALPPVPGASAAAGAGLVGAAVAFVSVQGRRLEEWVPVVAGWTVRGWRPRRARRWLCPDPASGHLVAAGRPSVGGARPERRSAPPFLSGCRFHAAATSLAPTEAGLVEDRGTLSVALAVSGGGFALLDPVDKERRLAAWASVLTGLAREGAVVRRLQWIERCTGRPGPYRSEAMDLVPDAPAGAADSYRQLLSGAGPPTPQHETLLVVTVGLRAGRTAPAVAALEREVAALVPNLRAAELEVGGALGPAALRAALAAGFCAADRWDAAGPWPVATEVGWAWLRADGWWHATYWVAEWPRAEVGPDFLVPLLMLGPGVRAVGLTMEPVPPARAAREVEAARTAGVADDELRRRGGFLSTARQRRLREGVAQREAELADGHGEYRFSGYVTVSATSMAELEANCSEVEHAAGQARLSLRRLYGQQDEAFTYTLPLGRGLR